MVTAPDNANPPIRRLCAKFLIVGGLFLWVAALFYGIGRLWAYEAAPGREASAPANWPAAANTALTPAHFNLVLFMHPHCPCSRATLDELARLMAHAGSNVSARVLFVSPAGTPPDWASTDLWRSAAAIPGVKAEVDQDGAQAQRFGAHTSGQALLYNSKGRLLFSGGITVSRGHSGDNAGESAILEIIAGAPAQPRGAPVYGCPLMDDLAQAASGGAECRK